MTSGPDAGNLESLAAGDHAAFAAMVGRDGPQKTRSGTRSRAARLRCPPAAHNLSGAGSLCGATCAWADQVASTAKTLIFLGAFAGAAMLLAPAPAVAQTCPCKPTQAGSCQRWHANEIPWSTYLGDGKKSITDVDFERAATAAFDAWATVTCDVCMKPDAKTKGCRPEACPPNPVGLRPIYQGKSAVPKLATACGGVYCADAGPGTAQLALIRDPAQWPLSAKVVTAPVLTINKAGEIVDADVLFFDNGHIFCTDNCKEGSQYDLAGAVMQEVGHFLGVGYSANTISQLAANFNPGAKLNPRLGLQDTQCVCEIYRTADNAAECEPKVAMDSGDCRAATGSRNMANQGNFGLVALAGAMLSVLGLRRRHSGRKALVP